ncbi:hypothetical protein F2Q69_00008995 [Brassica cretica]|uniref:Uncharacterized protein n=1 Tax=Brassica cretica TaxID=69181 RepID=A0A8S9PAP0_BRACR|nr:hypothetical protein F2Q69_00008995 [Brassica cretica]
MSRLIPAVTVERLSSVALVTESVIGLTESSSQSSTPPTGHIKPESQEHCFPSLVVVSIDGELHRLPIAHPFKSEQPP